MTMIKPMENDQIISEIEAFAAERGIAPATVTSRAVSNSRLHAHLKAGGGCTTRIVRRLQEYMTAKRNEGQATSRAG